MKKLCVFMVILLVLAQFGAFAEEAFDIAEVEETIVAEAMDEVVEEATADLALSEEPLQEEIWTEDEISEEQETAEAPEIVEPLMFAPMLDQDFAVENVPSIQPETPNVLLESSGFTDTWIDLTEKKASVTLDKGMQKYINLGDEYGSKWRSSNKKVATVNSEGLVTCKARGTTKITVKARPKYGRSSQTRTLTLKVVDPLDPDELYIYDGMEKEQTHGIQYSQEYSWRVVPGFKHQMEVSVVPEGSNKDVTWKSSKKKVVSITKSGYMTALKPGTATITAKSPNGLSVSLDIIVQKNYCYGVYNIDKALAYTIEEGTARIYLKSLNVVNNKRIDATFYLCNGTGKKITKLKNVTLTLECGYGNQNNGETYPFVSKRVSKIKVNSKSGKVTTFKARFIGKEILDPEWYLDNADIIVDEADCKFSY